MQHLKSRESDGNVQCTESAFIPVFWAAGESTVASPRICLHWASVERGSNVSSADISRESGDASLEAAGMNSK